MFFKYDSVLAYMESVSSILTVDQIAITCRVDKTHFYRYYEPMSEIIENRVSVVKFRTTLYFAQVTSIVKYFQK